MLRWIIRKTENVVQTFGYQVCDANQRLETHSFPLSCFQGSTQVFNVVLFVPSIESLESSSFCSTEDEVSSIIAQIVKLGGSI